MNIEKDNPAENELLISRVFDAPRQLVFKAWTEPERMMRWWGPKGFTAPSCTINLRPGGICRSCMRSPEGKDVWSQGTYLKITEPERLVFTDSFADKDGNIVSPKFYGMSPDWPDEALITVTFDEEAGGTKLTVRHSPLPPGPERAMCQQGWNESLDKLAAYLAERPKRTTKMMQAIALDRFGGLETMTLQTLPVPEIDPDEILVRMESAGVGVWDPFEREGGFAEMLNVEPKFPYVPGSDGAGTIMAVGEDGVKLALRLGADAATDGRTDDVVAAAHAFAPEGIDTALFTAGGEAADNALAAMRADGRIPYPNGVEFELQSSIGVIGKNYDGMPDPQAIEKLNRLIKAGPFEVHIARTFPLAQAVDAQRALDTHYLGKLALRPV